MDQARTEAAAIDVRLAAAAPDLLSFAKAVLPVLEDELEMRTFSFDEAYVEPVSKLVARCRRAIAKAEGR